MHKLTCFKNENVFLALSQKWKKEIKLLSSNVLTGRPCFLRKLVYCWITWLCMVDVDLERAAQRSLASRILEGDKSSMDTALIALNAPLRDMPAGKLEPAEST